MLSKECLIIISVLKSVFQRRYDKSMGWTNLIEHAFGMLAVIVVAVVLARPGKRLTNATKTTDVVKVTGI